MVDEAGRDVYDVTAPLLEHGVQHALRYVEEPREVHADQRAELVVGVVGERLGDEDAGVVDQGVDAAETAQCLRDHAFGRGRVRDVAAYGHDVRVRGGRDRA